jgi:hypothetical protein
MKPNLLETLKPELLAALEERYKDFPNILESIKSELAKNYYYTHIEYWVYSELYFLTKKAFGEYQHHFGDYFINK